ncbi:hypothetical protein COX00_00015 [Candidatus Uhrbacteria bacterium CG22_combo_CG10-13_8_21_14_all_47_17]|uniref:DUF8128 domain-containing protein n=1 Tax=Candidatus Uhrbacteria bacterium CG22_combo_CG10-13_8_21_14_all_47_17 TaxID=1975041 RepID=A0A2H0BTR3_9BACT|nr:MAG: hypothetical protein COX00_00015 [Candidatus Uhrbacteria bacterium CG22_combo_CG10-13_8_21_14_all_47_17]
MLQSLYSFSIFQFDLNAFLNAAGSDPFTAMVILFVNGGWIILVVFLFWMLRTLWLDLVQSKAAAKKEWVMLEIDIPRTSEQTVRAVENIFSNLAGAHSSVGWTDTWIHGESQASISIEIASIEGRVSFFVHSLSSLRDLIEASIYAQYPDAEIREAEDYTKNVPINYPDEEWDLWGTEMTNVQPDPYPLRTYPEFEDKVSGELKDPIAVLLENFSRLGKGEQAWYQIVMLPTDQKDFRKRAEKVINKLKGTEVKPKPSVLTQVIELPIQAAQDVMSVALGSSGSAPKKEEKKNDPPRMMMLSPGERYVLEAVERKESKIGFMCKIRFLYIAKKTVMKKSKAVQPFIGAIKQMNTFNMQALKPDLKRTGMSSNLWWFKARRNNTRKSKLIRAYRGRSSWVGLSPFQLSGEELATLWHFPILLQVRAPQLRRVEAKKAEPPANIPFA